MDGSGPTLPGDRPGEAVGAGGRGVRPLRGRLAPRRGAPDRGLLRRGRRGRPPGAAGRAGGAGARAAATSRRASGRRGVPGPLPRARRRRPRRLRSPGQAGRPPEPRDAGRDLLFGLLALQNDFVSRDDLLAAFAAWVADKAKPLARILADRGAIDPARAPCWRPSSPSTSAATAATPRPAWRTSARSARSATTSSGSATPTCRPASTPPSRGPRGPTPGRSRSDAPASRRAGGRFRILRFHREGGLGARLRRPRPGAAREVALKEIRPDKADDPASRTRFLLEAEITGGLEHPGIVPVYGLGPTPTAAPSTPCGSSRATASRRRSTAFHARTPAGRTRERSWSCASCWAGSSTSATRSPTRTAAASCTATSSRATSCRPLRRDAGGRLGAGQGHRPVRARRPAASATLRPGSASGSAGRCRAARAGDAGVHEPRAGRRRPRARWARPPTSTAWAPRCTAS